MSSLCRSSSNPPSEEQIAAMLKALGHPVRLMMVKQLLETNSRCCGELCECFDQSQSTLSQHLAVLRQSGILSSQRDGNRMLYCVEPGALELLSKVISDMCTSTRRPVNNE